MSSSTDNGNKFEHYVRDLYDELGKLNVKHDVTIKQRSKKGRVRSQFDVVYGIIRKRYVECKYRGKDRRVSFHDVTTFSGKLELIGADYSQGIMVTNQHYERRAYAYAAKIGLELVDRERLERLEKRRSGLLKGLFATSTLEDKIRRYASK